VSGRALGGSALAALAAAVLVLAGVAATGALGTREGHRTVGRFTLRGHVGGLYPGARKPLVLVVRNHGRRPVRVRSITTTVKAARPGCGARNVRVSRYRGRLRIRAGGSRRIALEARMPRTSPTACQGAVFPLVFRGRASR
jgi:hypothetical protein